MATVRETKVMAVNSPDLQHLVDLLVVVSAKRNIILEPDKESHVHVSHLLVINGFNKSIC